VPAEDCIDGKGGAPHRLPEIRASFNIISYLHEIYYNIGARADDANDGERESHARARARDRESRNFDRVIQYVGHARAHGHEDLFEIALT